MPAEDAGIVFQQKFIGRVDLMFNYTFWCGRSLRAMKKESRALPRKIICNEIGFTRPIFSSWQRSKTTPLRMKSINYTNKRSGRRNLVWKRKWLSNGWMSPWIRSRGSGTTFWERHPSTYLPYKRRERSAPSTSATMLSGHLGIDRQLQSRSCKAWLERTYIAAPAPPMAFALCAEPSNWQKILGGPKLQGVKMSPLITCSVRVDIHRTDNADTQD